jgi:hypothetical protein
MDEHHIVTGRRAVQATELAKLEPELTDRGVTSSQAALAPDRTDSLLIGRGVQTMDGLPAAPTDGFTAARSREPDQIHRAVPRGVLNSRRLGT